MKRDVLTDIARNARIAVQISWRYPGLLSYITTRLLRWHSGFKCVQCGLESGLFYLISRHNFKKTECILGYWESYLWIPGRGFSFLSCYFLFSLPPTVSLSFIFIYLYNFRDFFLFTRFLVVAFYGKKMYTTEHKMGQAARSREWWIVWGTNRHVVPLGGVLNRDCGVQ